MKTILRVLALSLVAILFTACSLLSQFQSVDTGSRRAAKVALTAYADFIQPAILTYGQLPDCSPAAPTIKLCKSHTAWVKIKGLEDKASTSVAAAGAVLSATNGSDQGQIEQAITDIQAVQAAFADAKKGIQ